MIVEKICDGVRGVSVSQTRTHVGKVVNNIRYLKEYFVVFTLRSETIFWLKGDVNSLSLLASTFASRGFGCSLQRWKRRQNECLNVGKR